MMVPPTSIKLRGYVMRFLLPLLAFVLAISSVYAGDGNRLSYLDSNEVWYPHKDFPKLITPQWVGEDGVECVVVLAIDDMRDTAKYEAYLRPILQRLKQIDGRAPVSIMTNSVKPDDPQLQTWLQEGLSLECHTADHPCPLLAGGSAPLAPALRGEGPGVRGEPRGQDAEKKKPLTLTLSPQGRGEGTGGQSSPGLLKAKATYDKCVDLMASIPNNKPVAFRTPCCDSLNTVSPRLFSEIINRTTPGGNFLQLDSSVFTLYTADDPSIPRELLTDPDGREKFRKYIPRKLARGNVVHDGFVNTIENYPYPYVIQRLCWEFPCMVPSDWSANHLHQPNNPDTVRDLKAALDITVLKQGVFNLVFHPHGWIKSEQVIELIDHAVAKHGKKVKFLTFKECVERLNKNLLHGDTLRDGYVAIMDLNKLLSEHTLITPELKGKDGIQIGVDDGLFDVLRHNTKHASRIWSQSDRKWYDFHIPPRQQAGAKIERDVDGDGVAEVFHSGTTKNSGQVQRDERFPVGISIWTEGERDAGLRFADLNEDGRLDIVLSNHDRFGAWLFESMEKGWGIELLNVKRGEKRADLELPPIVREDGSDNGFFVKDRHLCWINEDTDGLTDFIMRVAFDKLLGDRLPDAKSPEAAKQSMRVAPGYRVDLVAHEPLTMDPVAFDWGPDGKLWVAEMADYPNGIPDDEPDPALNADSRRAATAVPSPPSSGERARVRGPSGENASLKSKDSSSSPNQKTSAVQPSSLPHPHPHPHPHPPKAGGEGTGEAKTKRAGRIRFLEDTDGDGLYDKTTLFLDGVPFPNGVISWKKGVLVSAAPDIFYAEDTDGDGKADVKEVLFTGFSEGNQQHRANGFTRGLDNWLYLANGDSGGTVRSVKTGLTTDIRGRDIRIRPDTGEIEAVSGQTQFGRNRDDWGNWFGNNNSRPMYHYVLDDHYLRRNPYLAAPNPQRDVSIAPGAAPVFPSSRTLTRFNDFHTANRFTSACSAMVYRDEILKGVGNREWTVADTSQPLPQSPLPTAYSPSFVFISEPVHNLVHREIMRPDGFSFTSQRAVGEEQSEFLSSTDNWFRPTQLKTGPDGAFYVADMYRLVIEHPQWIPIEWQKKLDLRAGHDKGRIWRVAPVGTKLRPVPRFDKLTNAELVAALDSPNGWQRDLVQQLLIDKADPAAVPLLRGMVEGRGLKVDGQKDGKPSNSSADPQLSTLNHRPTSALARLHALCTLSALNDGLTVSVVGAGLNDPHPGVRRHAVRLCESVDLPKADLIEPLVKLVDDTDPQVRLQLAYTLGEIKHTQADVALGKLAARANGQPWMMAAVLSSLRADNLGAVMAEAMAHAGEQTGLLEQLLTHATAFKSSEAELALLTRVTEPGADGTFARWQFAAIEQYAIAVERRGETFNPYRTGTLQMRERFYVLFRAAETLAKTTETPIADRVAAVRILGPMLDRANTFELQQELLEPKYPPEVQSAALTSLARLKNNSDVPQILILTFRRFAPGLRTQVLETLLSRDEWRDLLLAALETKQLAPTDLDATSRQRLLDHKSKAVRERAAKLLAVDLNTDRAKLVTEYLPTVRAGGDVQHGSQLFAKRCAQCHKLGSVGHAVGPDLASLTDKSPEAMLTAILDPNRAVETKFLTFAAVTKSGVTHTGILASETASSLTLRAAEAKETTLLRNELDELQSSTKSLMPEGLEKEVSPADAAALIAYIRNNVPLPARKSFPGNEPAVVKANADGSITLTPFTAEIYGPTIVIEEKHKNLGWWSSADDTVSWTINVPRAGRYAVSWTWACEASAAGNTLVIEAAGKSLRHKVPATSSWDDYQTGDLGELELPAGEIRLTIKPASRPLPALADVKEVKLRPLPSGESP